MAPRLVRLVGLAAAAAAALPPPPARRDAPLPLLLRGGTALGPMLMATPAAAVTGGVPLPKLVNCVGGAASFFANVRLPAALLAGASIGQLFVKVEDRRGKWVQMAFTISMIVTTMLELSVVFVSTASGTRLLAGGFDPMAYDALAFLVREFELPFTLCRAFFFTGLKIFVAALGLRIWATIPCAGPYSSPRPVYREVLGSS